MFYDDDKNHDPEVQEWYHRMMKDPGQWEKFRYTDTINAYKNLIDELEQ